jgi:hypothetical protein
MMIYKSMTAAFLVSGLSLTVACSSNKASAPAGKQSSKTDECSSDAKAKKKAELRSSFSLAETTYDDIKDLVKDECADCHKAGGPGGLDLSTYTALKANADDVIRTITSDDSDEVMPSSGKMSSSKIAKIKAWVDDGKKPGGDNEDESEDTEEEKEDEESAKDKKSSTKGSKTSSDEECAESDDDGDLEKDDEKNSKTDSGEDEKEVVEEKKTELVKNDLDPELFKLYIEPAELKACHAEGKTYLRAGTAKDPADPTPRCDAVAHPGKFTCDKAGTLAAFANHPTVVAKVDEYLAKGYEFDQCGDAGGKPVVYFVCFKGTEDKCVAKDKLVGTNLSILTGSIGRP